MGTHPLLLRAELGPEHKEYDDETDEPAHLGERNRGAKKPGPLVEGRDFTEADRKGSEPVVVVSKSIAERLFPGQDALNRHIKWTDPVIKFADISPEPRRIVGVLADVDDANIIPQPNLTVYSPFAQSPIFGANLLVRTKSDPYALLPTITKPIVQPPPLSPSSTPARCKMCARKFLPTTV